MSSINITQNFQLSNNVVISPLQKASATASHLYEFQKGNSKFLIRFSTTACTCNKQIFTASGIKIQDIDIRLSMYEVRAEAAVIIFNIMKIISLSIIVTIYYKFVT